MDKRLPSPHGIKLFSAANEPDDTVKFCKICRLMNAADFAFVDVLPENSNVGFEVGYMLGQNKPVLYLCNTTQGDPSHVYFDLSDRMLITYHNKKELFYGLEKTAVPFFNKVILRNRAMVARREAVRQNIEALDDKQLEILKYFYLMRPIIQGLSKNKYDMRAISGFNFEEFKISELFHLSRIGMLIGEKNIQSNPAKDDEMIYTLNEFLADEIGGVLETMWDISKD